MTLAFAEATVAIIWPWGGKGVETVIGAGRLTYNSLWVSKNRMFPREYEWIQQRKKNFELLFTTVKVLVAVCKLKRLEFVPVNAKFTVFVEAISLENWKFLSTLSDGFPT